MTSAMSSFFRLRKTSLSYFDPNSCNCGQEPGFQRDEIVTGTSPEFAYHQVFLAATHLDRVDRAHGPARRFVPNIPLFAPAEPLAQETPQQTRLAGTRSSDDVAQEHVPGDFFLPAFRLAWAGDFECRRCGHVEGRGRRSVSQTRIQRTRFSMYSLYNHSECHTHYARYDNVVL